MMRLNNQEQDWCRGGRMVGRLQKVVPSGVLLIIAVGLSCVTERGLEPSRVDYRLYVGIRNIGSSTASPFVLAFDCQTDTVVDSLNGTFGNDLRGIFASKDGNYLVINTSGPDYLWDLNANEAIGVLPASFASAEFVTLLSREILVINRALSLSFFKPPSLEPYFVDTLQFAGARQIPGTQYLIGLRDRESDEEPRQVLLLYDMELRHTTDTILIDLEMDGTAFYSIFFDVSPDGRRLYAVGNDVSCQCLIGYDLVERRVLFTYPTDFPGGHPRVSPDGTEVWLTHGGLYGLGDSWRQYISILDAEDGTLIDTISVHQDALHWPRPVAPIDFRFLPDGSKVYLFCGGPAIGAQPLLSIERNTHEIELIMSSTARQPEAIDLSPKP